VQFSRHHHDDGIARLGLKTAWLEKQARFTFSTTLILRDPTCPK
jgi:hypothetical protein